MSAPEYKPLLDDPFEEFTSPWSGINKPQGGINKPQETTEDEFNVTFVRHCYSCANDAKKVRDFKKKFWRQPLCTDIGVVQAIAAGWALKKILPKGSNQPFLASILPRALITAKFASVSYDNTYPGNHDYEKLEVNDLDKLVDKLDLDKHDLDNPSTENFSGGAWGKQNLPEKER